MTWALKRQLLYVFIVIVFLLVFGFLIAYPYFNKVPTCFDGKQNGVETGVDCGGLCARACVLQTDAVSVLWARSFMVIPGRYNAVAYLENQNKNLAVNKINYSFRFADKDNVYLGKREGTITVPPGRAFAVFERGIELGNSAPVYTTFQFTQAPDWLRVSETKLSQLKVLTSDINLQEPDSNPHLTATLENNSLFQIPEVEVVAILYDEKGNAVNASSTYVELLGPQEKTTLNFTWPIPFDKKVITTEILPLYNIFNATLK